MQIGLTGGFLMVIGVAGVWYAVGRLLLLRQLSSDEIPAKSRAQITTVVLLLISITLLVIGAYLFIRYTF